MTDNKQYPPLPDFEEVEQYIYGASRRYIQKDMLEPIHELMRAYVEADRKIRAANTKRQYYYHVDECGASDAYASNCICWHDEGTGPMAGKIDWAMVDWRDVPAPASQDAEDAARYRWLRDVGDKTWTPLRERPGFSEKAIDVARAAKEGGA